MLTKALNGYTERDKKIITAVTIFFMIAAIAFALINPAFASGIQDKYQSVMQNIFTILISLFSSTCCVVILISLFLMLIATNDSEVQKGIHRIKVALGCVIAAYLVTILVNQLTNTMSGTGSEVIGG